MFKDYRRQIGVGIGDSVLLIACALYAGLAACAGLWWLFLRFAVMSL